MTQENYLTNNIQGLVCPLPNYQVQSIVIGHGSGGAMTHDLINNMFQSRINNPILAEGNDAARLLIANSNDQIVVSTDSHVVSPLFFPGGDIGRLSIAGTVNDVAMLGARPIYLTAGFILEEGFLLDDLARIIDSMAITCQEAGVQIVAGDTKVVEKGKADGVYISTAGIGLVSKSQQIGGQFAQPGDAVLISGTLGEHSIAVIQARGDLGFESEIKSDVAPLNHMIADLIDAVPDIHVLRDPTRGGVATSLNEIAFQSQVSIHLDESSIPVKSEVRVACEMLGFDPLYLANEGKVIVILPEEQVEKALMSLKNSPYGIFAQRIGVVEAGNPGQVFLHTGFGTTRMVTMLSGELLPRIC